MGQVLINKTDSEAQSVPTPKGALEIRVKWCKGCGLCIDACPKKVLSLDELSKIQVAMASECNGCGMCEATCPDFAIRVIKNA